jgi:hypothetical protein
MVVVSTAKFEHSTVLVKPHIFSGFLKINYTEIIKLVTVTKSIHVTGRGAH